MHEGNGYAGHGVRAEDVTADHEAGQRKGSHENLLARPADAILEHRNILPQRRIVLGQPRQDHAPKIYEQELDDRQGHRPPESSQDGLGRGVGEDGCRVPETAEELE